MPKSFKQFLSESRRNRMYAGDIDYSSKIAFGPGGEPLDMVPKDRKPANYGKHDVFGNTIDMQFLGRQATPPKINRNIDLFTKSFFHGVAPESVRNTTYEGLPMTEVSWNLGVASGSKEEIKDQIQKIIRRNRLENFVHVRIGDEVIFEALDRKRYPQLDFMDIKNNYEGKWVEGWWSDNRYSTPIKIYGYVPPMDTWEIYSKLPMRQWPEDQVLLRVEDGRDGPIHYRWVQPIQATIKEANQAWDLSGNPLRNDIPSSNRRVRPSIPQHIEDENYAVEIYYAMVGYDGKFDEDEIEDAAYEIVDWIIESVRPIAGLGYPEYFDFSRNDKAKVIGSDWVFYVQWSGLGKIQATKIIEYFETHAYDKIKQKQMVVDMFDFNGDINESYTRPRPGRFDDPQWSPKPGEAVGWDMRGSKLNLKPSPPTGANQKMNIPERSPKYGLEVFISSQIYNNPNNIFDVHNTLIDLFGEQPIIFDYEDDPDVGPQGDDGPYYYASFVFTTHSRREDAIAKFIRKFEDALNEDLADFSEFDVPQSEEIQDAIRGQAKEMDGQTATIKISFRGPARENFEEWVDFFETQYFDLDVEDTSFLGNTAFAYWTVGAYHAKAYEEDINSFLKVYGHERNIHVEVMFKA